MTWNILQGSGSLAFTAGLFMLAGIGWTLLIVGFLALVVGVAAEMQDDEKKKGGSPNGISSTDEQVD